MKTHVKCPDCGYKFNTRKPLVAQCSKSGGGCGNNFLVEENED